MCGQRSSTPTVWASRLSWMNRRVVAKASQANVRNSTSKAHKWEAKATGCCENDSMYATTSYKSPDHSSTDTCVSERATSQKSNGEPDRNQRAIGEPKLGNQCHARSLANGGSAYHGDKKRHTNQGANSEVISGKQASGLICTKLFLKKIIINF